MYAPRRTIPSIELFGSSRVKQLHYANVVIYRESGRPDSTRLSQGDSRLGTPFEKAEVISGVEDAQEWSPLAGLGFAILPRSGHFARCGAISSRAVQCQDKITGQLIGWIE
jgi:hypothetical protein